MSTDVYEKLGAFYLGREYDLGSSALKDDLILYDAKDLTTHGICVGMTGSGKTGLCLGLLEEAAIDGIPAIAIDPKGDLGNLMLTFPDLAPASFRPWVDEGEATRKGMTTEAYAKSVATLWKKGLKEWDQDGTRIQRFRDAADVAIYTPGSQAGLPLTILRSFDAPPAAILEDGDALRDRIQAAVSGLLALLGIRGDPVQSREHILLSNLLNTAWQAGRDLDLPSLIREIQQPPFDKVGVFDLESFFPARERFGLAMTLNNLLASPGFAAWAEGDPLDIGRLLYTPEGKPRIAILSIAHLSDAERMFFVTILLNEVLTWVRSQPGTSSLRALLYMDEIFGFFPPTENPPSKQPMLTLLKQARAFGVGVMLATQNPVDLDYKGLSNTGTWFIGRLQTERDKLRVLDGLEGAAATGSGDFNRSRMEKILAGLGSRVFLMHNVHEERPVIFHTRWVLSYLRGPMTRRQIQALMADRRSAAAPAASGPPAIPAPKIATVSSAEDKGPTGERPVLPSSVREYFLPLQDAVGDNDRLVYRPAITGAVRLHYAKAAARIDDWINLSVLAPIPDDLPGIAWDESDIYPGKHLDLERRPGRDGHYAELPAAAANGKSHTRWAKDLKTWIYQSREVTVYKCAEIKTYSNLGETEGEFRARIRHALHERRDLAVEKLRKKHGAGLARLQDRVRRAEAKVEREESQHGQQKMQTVISIGATILGAFTGRKMTSSRNIGRATTAMRGAGRAMREKEDIQLALEALDAEREKLEQLEADFAVDIEALEESMDVDSVEFDTQLLRPRKADIFIEDFGVAWTPWRVDESGIAEPIYRRPG